MYIKDIKLGHLLKSRISSWYGCSAYLGSSILEDSLVVGFISVVKLSLLGPIFFKVGYVYHFSLVYSNTNNSNVCLMLYMQVCYLCLSRIVDP